MRMNTVVVSVVLGTISALAIPAAARFASPTEAPVDRLVKNVTAYVREHPDDAHGHYVLARIHGLALALESGTVRIYESRRPGELPTVDHQFHRRGGGETPDLPTMRTHLTRSLTHFDRAIALEPGSALYRLGRACVLEAGGRVAAVAPPGISLSDPTAEESSSLEGLVRMLGEKDAEVRDGARREIVAAGPLAIPVIVRHIDSKNETVQAEVRKLLGRFWTEAAIDAYRDAFDRSVEADLATSEMPIRGVRSLVAYEAGSSYLRLVRDRGVRDEEKKYMRQVVEALVELQAKKRRGPITPIVFPLDHPRPLRALLEQSKRVVFDLDGDGLREAWPWVGSATAILVWDPQGRGRIESGRQLFGSVTWWILWRNGYEALDALDDDRDGRLAGKELTGLAVWRDRNGNGVSDPGEVVPLRHVGIVEIATRPTTVEDGCPAHPTGLRLADGRRLPTYDWIAFPDEPSVSP